MNKEQSGFTLIELVMVIVILGILAAVAVPKFVDLSTKADEAAVKGVAGGLSAASAANYAAKKAGAGGVAVASCADVSSALATPLPSGYTLATTAVADGATVTCSVTGGNSQTASFVAIGAT